MDTIPEETETSGPYKIIKMDSGEDIICKIIQEFSDAFIVERPMSIVETPQFSDDMKELVSHTGVSKWLNFTNDTRIVISKTKIMTVANLAPEVSYFYKHICKKMVKAEKDQVKSEEEVAKRMDDLKKLAANLKDIEGDNVVPFLPIDKSKLH